MKIPACFCLAIVACLLTASAQQMTPSLRERLFNGDTTFVSAMPMQASHLADEADAHWDSRFGMPGVDGEVHALAADGDWIYFGGLFMYAGNTPVNGIGRWNRVTHAWQSLGSGVDGLIVSIAIRGDSVFVGGQFTHAGDVDAENIAVWNKRTGTWSAMGQGSRGDRYAYVSSIAVDDRHVYVGGRFTAVGTLIANNIAVWDGKTWERLGAGLNKHVYGMLAYAGKLYVGGAFTTAGIDSARHVAVWDGSRWSTLGAGFNADVYTFAVNKGTLYAGGDFTKSGDSATGCVARWDLVGGGRWIGLQDTFDFAPSSIVMNLAVHNDSIIAVGRYALLHRTGGILGVKQREAICLAIWDGRWHAPDTGWVGGVTSTDVYTALVEDNALYLGGAFVATGYVSDGSLLQPALNIVHWDFDARRWMIMGAGVNNEVRRLAMRGADLYIAGAFIGAGFTWASRIVSWDGRDWTPLGSGVSAYGGSDYGRIEALALGVTNVYVTGFIITRYGEIPDDTARYTIARSGYWDGLRWTPMLMDYHFTDSNQIGVASITALAVSHGELYAGRSGGHSFLRWNPSTQRWARVPGSDVNDTIKVMTPTSGDELYIGTNKGIIRWNRLTGAITSLGDGVNGEVMAITVHGDRVYVGGRFTKAGSRSANLIAVYNTTTNVWSDLDGGVDRIDPKAPPYVSAIAVDSLGRVYAGGWFSVAGNATNGSDILANNIAMFDGESWQSLGSGVDDVVNAIAVSGDDVYVGGKFHNVGDIIPSWFFAHWNATTLGVKQQKIEAKTMQLRAEPNPANGRTQLHYTTTVRGHVRLSVCDVVGREVAVLVDEEMSAGEHLAQFDAGDLVAGLYYCHVTSSGATVTTSLVVMR